ncbi:hypothetical protein D3C81_2139160 [compost metagenome]
MSARRVNAGSASLALARSQISGAVCSLSGRLMPKNRRSSRWVQLYSGLPTVLGTVTAQARNRS